MPGVPTIPPELKKIRDEAGHLLNDKAPSSKKNESGWAFRLRIKEHEIWMDMGKVLMGVYYVQLKEEAPERYAWEYGQNKTLVSAFERRARKLFRMGWTPGMPLVPFGPEVDY